MKPTAIIQARMGSHRLPGKVLAPLGSKTLLEQVVSRVSQIKGLAEVAVATTILSEDDVIERLCGNHGVRCFRGHPIDVLDRFFQIAKKLGLSSIVRITADSPFLDPEVSTNVVRRFAEVSPDFASNGLKSTFPVGLGTEVMTFEALRRAWEEAKGYHRVHVTSYFVEHPEKFNSVSIEHEEDLSGLRWTVDTPEDLAMAQKVYEGFSPREDFSMRELLAFLKKHPRIQNLNRHISQKGLEEG